MISSLLQKKEVHIFKFKNTEKKKEKIQMSKSRPIGQWGDMGAGARENRGQEGYGKREF